MFLQCIEGLSKKRKNATHRKHGLTVASPMMGLLKWIKDMSSLSWWPRPRSMPERLWCQGPRGRRGRGPIRKKRHANWTPSRQQSIANRLDPSTNYCLLATLYYNVIVHSTPLLSLAIFNSTTPRQRYCKPTFIKRSKKKTNRTIISSDPNSGELYHLM